MIASMFRNPWPTIATAFVILIVTGLLLTVPPLGILLGAWWVFRLRRVVSRRRLEYEIRMRRAERLYGFRPDRLI